MKNANPIRELLKSALDVLLGIDSTNATQNVHDYVEDALALLPCETCNGTGQIPNKTAAPHCSSLRQTCVDCCLSSICLPCPDCTKPDDADLAGRIAKGDPDTI